MASAIGRWPQRVRGVGLWRVAAIARREGHIFYRQIRWVGHGRNSGGGALGLDNFSGFAATLPPATKPEKSSFPLASAVCYANA